MKYGDEIIGTIQDIDDKGRGFFITETDTGAKRTIVIPFTSVGDLVRATVRKRERGHTLAEIVSIEEPAPTRVETPCPHAGICGGCLWQHMAYDAQLELKRDMINRAFEHAHHEERIDAVMPCPNVFYYRNRMDYVISWRGEVGMKAYGYWNRYLDLKTCLLLDKETPNILAEIRTVITDLKIQPWDPKSADGNFHYCVIRLGKNTGERMIMLLFHSLSALEASTIEEIKKRLSPLCTTLCLGENPEDNDVSRAKTIQHLSGNELLKENINGLTYSIHANSFFQTNSVMAAELQKTVLDFCGNIEGKKVLDLYCGLGFFGIAAAKKRAQVYGHELDADAIELAQKNAEANDVATLCRWGAGEVEKLDWKTENPDVVIVDPPRAGLHPKALQTLMKNAPHKIVYVSCNYRRLAEELKVFKTDYKVETIRALDLFPQTPHVEVVARLTHI